MTRTANLVLTSAFVAGLLTPPALAFDSYSIDGSGNNLSNSAWGQVDSQLLRLMAPAYDDDFSVPRGGNPSTLPSPRAISNAVAAQSGSVLNSASASDWLWQWGQFLDHDIDLTEGANPAEPFNIPVPTGDPYFDPSSTGTEEIGLNRSVYTNDSSGVRQQHNQISAYIDASNVYGSDPTRATTLRELDGSGRLKTSTGDLLPFNTSGLPNAGGTSSTLFLAGDVRANEQVGLTSTHTLFMREHNRLAGDLKSRLDLGETALEDKRDTLIADTGNSIDNEGDFLYESARKLVAAQLQKITYEEFIPVLMGQAMTPYSGYDNLVNAGIANEFSSAAYRVGHTMLSPTLQRLNNDGTTAVEGDLPLQNAFFNPSEITSNGIDSLLLGLASQKAQEIDTLVVDDVRNFLFGPPGAGGFDLASLNLQRGRDHGVPALNDARAALGLVVHPDFLSLTDGDATLAAAFASVYASVDDVDLWIGGLAEAHLGAGLLGETFIAIHEDQFLRLRDGDRLFYLSHLDHLEVLDPNFDSTLLSDIIQRNTTITGIQSNVFYVVPEPTTALLALLTVAGLTFRSNRIA